VLHALHASQLFGAHAFCILVSLRMPLLCEVVMHTAWEFLMVINMCLQQHDILMTARVQCIERCAGQMALFLTASAA
jgi:hypothetical protein